MSPEHQEEQSSPAWRTARDWGARIYDLGLHSSPSTQRTGPIYKIKAHMLKPSLSLVLSFTGYSFRKFFPTAATPAEGLLMLPADVPPQGQGPASCFLCQQQQPRLPAECAWGEGRGLL